MASNYENTFGVTEITAATATITADGYVGTKILVNRAAGCTITLPAASGSGNTYTFIGGADASGSQIIQVASASDTMMGGAVYTLTDGVTAFNTADTSDTITLNGTTSGGYKGWRVTVCDIDANVWQVEVQTEASGTEVTCFSAAV